MDTTADLPTLATGHQQTIEPDNRRIQPTIPISYLSAHQQYAGPDEQPISANRYQVPSSLLLRGT
jgi:hypothetical protein